MFSFSARGDGVSSPGLSLEVVAEAELGASAPGPAVTGRVWEYFKGTLWRD